MAKSNAMTFSCQYADVSIKFPAAVNIGLLAHFHSYPYTLFLHHIKCFSGQIASIKSVI